jgi:tetratricopeptide (TPR) repeat protein
MPTELETCLTELARLARLQADQMQKQADESGKTSWADRIDAALKTTTRVALAVVSAAAAAILVIMAVNAALSRSVIVDAFDVPKALADRGLSKQVVAETVLDALNETQAATRLAAGGKLRLTEAWNEPLKLEIPQAHISVGELRDLLHQSLGHDIHVTGELVQLPGGDLMLTVRGTGIPARQFRFKEPDLQCGAKTSAERDFQCPAKLAAEYVYGTAEPVAFATYLVQQFRMKDGLAFAKARFASTPPEFRPALALQWAKLSAYSGDFKHAVELDQLVLKLDPYNWPAWEELAQDKRLLEGPESELKTFQDMHIRASHAPFTRKARLIDFRLEYNLLHNHATEIRALLEDQETVLGGTEGTSSWYGLAMAELGRHGFASAQRYMDEADPNDPLLKEHLHDVQAGLHPATDAAAILHDREEADEAANEAYRNIIPDGPCGLAISYARLGRKQEALDTLARVQKQNAKVGCGGNAGIVLQYLGDPAGADTAFASAIAAAPSLPDAYEQRGEVRMMRQDWAGAAADFDIAHQKSPHWADPLKYGGDALVKLGRPSQALQKYRAALACAPEWPDLRDAMAAIGSPPAAASRNPSSLYPASTDPCTT